MSKIRLVLGLMLVFTWQQGIAIGVNEMDPDNKNILLGFGKNADGRYNNFMRYDSDEAERLYVNMNQGDVFHFGFQPMAEDQNGYKVLLDNFWVRIKDMDGNIVYGPTEIVQGQQGYIADRASAEIGPLQLNTGGYNALSFEAADSGQYYLEVVYSADGITDDYKKNNLRHLAAKYYDFTVTNAAQEIKTGRVWSKAWHFIAIPYDGKGGFETEVFTKQYIYSDDQITTLVDFNGMKPYEWIVISNATGVNNTGDIAADRASINSKLGAELLPQYKLFYDEPDTTFFPTANPDSIFGRLNDSVTISGCPGNYCINIDVSNSVSAKILLDLNGIPDFQEGTEDLVLEKTLNKGPNCIQWDGLDGLGHKVHDAKIQVELNFIAGITHLPKFDVESSMFGFKASLIYPEELARDLEMYWDDSNVKGKDESNSGCISGCHVFGDDNPDPSKTFGNEKIINSWWYIEKDPEVFNIPLIIYFLNLDNDSICEGEVAQLDAPTDLVSFTWRAQDNNNSVIDNRNISNPKIITNKTTEFILNALDTNSCNLLDTLELLVHPKPAIKSSGNDEICIGDSIDISISAGANDTLFWLTDFGDSSVTNQFVKPVVQSAFRAKAITENGCIDSLQFVIDVNALPVPVISSSTEICLGASTTLQISGGGTYLWTSEDTDFNNPNGNSIEVSPESNTMYYAKVTNAKNCEAIDSVLVKVIQTQKPEIGPNDTLCPGENIQFSLLDTLASYSWEPQANFNDPTIANPVFSPSNSSLVIATLEDKRGCIHKDSLWIEIVPLPILSGSPNDVICIGDSVQISVTSTETIQWLGNNWVDASQLQQWVKPTSNTQYEVRAINRFDCKDTVAVTVSVNKLPIVTINSHSAICQGDSTTLLASGGVKYNWSPTTYFTQPTLAKQTFLPLVDGTYKVKVTDANSCENEDSISIKILKFNDPDIGNGDTLCPNQSKKLALLDTMASYQWSPIALFDNPTISNPLISPKTSTWVYVDMIDKNGCSHKDSLELIIRNNLVIDVDSVTPQCLGASFDLSARSNLSKTSFEWFNQNTIQNAKSAHASISPSQSTTVRVIGTSQFGCLDSNKVFVKVYPLPQINATNDTAVCAGDAVNVAVEGTNSYEWISALTLPSTTDSVFSFVPNQNGNLYVTGTSVQGCIDKDTMYVEVLVNPVPKIEIEYDNDICMGDTVFFKITSYKNLGTAPIYTWSKIAQDNSISSIGKTQTYSSMNIDNTESYKLSVTSNLKCVALDQRTVESNIVSPKVYQYPDLEAPDTIACFGESISIPVSDRNNVATSYTWGIQDTLINSTKTFYETDTVYKSFTYEVSANNWYCFDKIIRKVEVVRPQINVETSDTVIFLGEEAQLTLATNTNSWNWYTKPVQDWSPDPFAKNLTVAPIEDVRYRVVGTVQTCEAEDTVTIKVLYPINAPYFVSPNEDGENDIWIVDQLDTYEDTEVKIYNRWGTKVKELGNKINTWDGRTTWGGELPDGVYFYVITGTAGRTEIAMSGYVTISH